MKQYWKIGATVTVVILFCLVKPWLQAVDFGGAYERANVVWSFAQGVYQKAKETVSSAASTGAQYLASDSVVIKTNPYKNSVATIRIGNVLNVDERAYLAKRKPKVKAAFEKMLGRSLDGKYVPTMAIVASGGGYRAMLGTIGGLCAAEKLGITAATTYITALSGSTWALSAWVSTGMSIESFKQYVQNSIQKDIYKVTLGEAKNIIDMFAVKLAFDEPLTTVDVYGALLANHLLSKYGSDCQRVYLSQQAGRVQNGDIPYPIYTAIDAREAVAREPHWYEFTPHEIGSPYFGVYVPAWGYGRKFYGGGSTDFAPEQSLGFLMATWGSAHGVHFGRVWEEIIQGVPGSSLIRAAVEKKLVDPLTGKRVDASWGEVFNFMYGIPNQELQSRPTIKFVDAGIDFNLPYPPVSGERPERKADIMLFLDFSGGSLLYSLKKTEEYARRKGLKFPKIDYTDVEKKALSVFKDPSDPSVPVVIYLPRISDAALWSANKSNPAFKSYSSIEGFNFDECTNKSGGDCGTLRFMYPKNDSQLLIDQMEFNMMVHKDQIMEMINWVIDQKSQ
ncbi:MAG TPA: hypothetical protein VJJ26_04250 [Candidatus Babeliales bacterium]|nr:hypothetical protein [Candidatus Babeliales bacterium]